MLTTATLHRLPAARGTPRAWFLPGADPARWLEEVAHWPIATERIRFLVLARRDPVRVEGVLAIPAEPIVPPAGLRGQPYGEAAPGFFLPVDATLEPPLDAAELRALCPHTTVYHPALGLHGFTETEVRHAWDLLQPAFASPGGWNRAVPPPPAGARLRGVRLAAPLTLTTIFGEESKDIGSEPLDDLPPADNEPKGGLPGRLLLGAAGLTIQGLLKVTSLLPRMEGIAPTWINHLENWAQRRLAGVARNLDQQRFRELQRLMELLDRNPEEGLRHAISLADLAHRGKAPPSGSLGRRPLDFDNLRSGGGGAADSWHVPADIQAALAKRYRENAEREAKLGRFRRAAYIYAELLGDFSAAAGVLKQGRCFREAATLYQERLRQPLLAAACLAEGGLALEAVEIYEKHAKWLEAADLYKAIGRIDDEKRVVRRAVQECRGRYDTLGAARLLEQRLGEAEEALALLADNWPQGRQALLCLEERFALLGRMRRGAETTALIRELGTRRPPAAHHTDLIGLLARLAETAAGDIRQAATEAVRRQAAEALTRPGADRAGEVSVLRSLTRLAPRDRLLVRDASRYREKRPVAVPAPPPPVTGPLIRRLTPENLQLFQLPPLGRWVHFSDCAGGFHAVCSRPDQQLVFARGIWKGEHEIQSTTWPDPRPQMKDLLVFAPGSVTAVLGRPTGEPLAWRTLPPGSGHFSKAFSVGTPDWLPPDAVQVAQGPGTHWAVRLVGSRVVLASYAVGEQVSSLDVTDEIAAAGAETGGHMAWLDAAGASGRVALAYGNGLLVLNDQGPLKTHKLPSRIQALLPSDPALPGWIVVLEYGAVFVSARTGETTVLDDTLLMARAGRLGNGRLALVGKEEGKLFQCQEGRWVPAGWFQAPKAMTQAVAVSGCDEPDAIAICSDAGRVEVWRLR